MWIVVRRMSTLRRLCARNDDAVRPRAVTPLRPRAQVVELLWEPALLSLKQDDRDHLLDVVLKKRASRL